ncbi:hypothetical protein WMY93_019153 [Mugilogobius chulae]|uniref:Cystatin domain-containing protein n=1 Tax=Mugilogobius chulae TaxID=88201 RepID=A0AAW0NNR0_9GOBI
MIPVHGCPKEFLCGGIGRTRPANEDVQDICNFVKSDVEKRMGKTYDTYQAISYKTQTVAGCNYIVKVHVGGDQHLDVIVYKAIRGNHTLMLRSVKESERARVRSGPEVFGLTLPLPPEATLKPPYREGLLTGPAGIPPDAGLYCKSNDDVECSNSTRALSTDQHVANMVEYHQRRGDYGWFWPTLACVMSQWSRLWTWWRLNLLERFGMFQFTDEQFPECGDICESRPADQEVQEICDEYISQTQSHKALHSEMNPSLPLSDNKLPWGNSAEAIHLTPDTSTSDYHQVFTNMHVIRWWGNRSARRKPPRHGEEHANSTQEETLLASGTQTHCRTSTEGSVCQSSGSEKTGCPTEPMDFEEMLCGGASGSQPANREMQNKCDFIKSEVEKELGKKYDTFQAKSYKSQSTNPPNYWIEVHVGGDKYVSVFVSGHSDEPRLRSCHEYTL